MSSILVCCATQPLGVNAHGMVGLQATHCKRSDFVKRNGSKRPKKLIRKGRGIWSLGWNERKQFNVAAVTEILNNMEFDQARSCLAKLAILKEIEIFQHMHQNVIQFLAYNSNFTTFEYGSTIYKYADSPTKFYFLLKGHIIVKRRVYDKFLDCYTDHPVRLIRPGDFIGGYELATSSVMLHTYVANSSAIILLSLDADCFLGTVRNLYLHFWYNRIIPRINASMLYSAKERQLFFAQRLSLITKDGNFNFDNVVGNFNFKFEILEKMEERSVIVEILDLDKLGMEVELWDEQRGQDRRFQTFIQRFKQDMDMTVVLENSHDNNSSIENSKSDSVLVDTSHCVGARETVCSADDSFSNCITKFRQSKYLIAGRNERLFGNVVDSFNWKGPNTHLEHNPQMHYILTSPLNDYGYMVSILRNSHQDYEILAGCVKLANVFEIGKSLMLKRNNNGPVVERNNPKSAMPMHVFCLPRKWALRGITSGMAV